MGGQTSPQPVRKLWLLAALRCCAPRVNLQQCFQVVCAGVTFLPFFPSVRMTPLHQEVGHVDCCKPLKARDKQPSSLRDPPFYVVFSSSLTRMQSTSLVILCLDPSSFFSSPIFASCGTNTVQDCEISLMWPKNTVQACEGSRVWRQHHTKLCSPHTRCDHNIHDVTTSNSKHCGFACYHTKDEALAYRRNHDPTHTATWPGLRTKA